MTVKDLFKNSDSLYYVAVFLLVLVGVALLILISGSQDEVADVVQDANTMVVNGRVDSLVEDCVRNERFENGELIKELSVTCDGGSHVNINDLLITTSSGFVPADQSFSHDISDIHAGDFVEIRYQRNDYGFLDLNCDDCSIRLLEASQN